MLSGVDPSDFLVGAAAALAAGWTSLRLLPPGGWRLLPMELARFALHFLYQSVIAGVDVARRALAPQLKLRPGFAICELRLPPGPTRSVFCTLTSLLPGTVPTGSDAEDRLIVHCLDTGQPVAAELAKEEALLTRALLGTHGGRGNG